MTTGDHVIVPKALLWAIAASLFGVATGGSFWLGGLSSRVAALENGQVTAASVNIRLDTFNSHLTAIDERLKFVLQHDFPGQSFGDRADK